MAVDLNFIVNDMSSFRRYVTYNLTRKYFASNEFWWWWLTRKDPIANEICVLWTTFSDFSRCFDSNCCRFYFQYKCQSKKVDGTVLYIFINLCKMTKLSFVIFPSKACRNCTSWYIFLHLEFSIVIMYSLYIVSNPLNMCHHN